MSKSHQQQSGHTNIWLFALELGFFAGLIWGGLHWLVYWFSFTKVSPGFIAEPFFRHAFLTTAFGHFVGYMMFIVFSVIASMLYVLLLRKLKGPWPGLVYGVLWWAIIFIPGSQMFLMQPHSSCRGTLSLVSSAFFCYGECSLDIQQRSSIRTNGSVSKVQRLPNGAKKLLKGISLC